jgi:DNA-directed RNA polymerase specialized sigma24 family protein
MTSFTTFADDQLMYFGATGDNNTLNELINPHKNKLYTSIFFRVKDKYLFEDIFQDTFIKAIIPLTSENMPGKESFWIGL